MKNLATLSLLALALCTFLGWPQTASAQADQDTVTVDPGINTLFDAVVGDTTDSGERVNPDRVYKLVRGGVYFQRGQIGNDYPVRVVGEKGPEGTPPPTIQLSPDETGTVPDKLFFSDGDLTLKNLYIIGRAPTGTSPFSLNKLAKENGRYIIDNCIFEYVRGVALEASGGSSTIRITNSIFRNDAGVGFYRGRAFESEAAQVQDTVYFENNTFLNLGGFVFQGPRNGDIGVEHFWFNHNTIINIRRFPFLSESWAEAYVTNNIYVNAIYGGSAPAERIGQDPDGLSYSVATNVDSLGEGVDLEEEDRIILLYANDNWRDPAFDEYYASTDTVEGNPWLNSRSQMFFDRYEGMVNKKLYTQQPNFQNAPGSDLVDEYVEALTAFRMGNSPDQAVFWDPGRDQDQLTPVQWPLPEVLSYDNGDLKSAGVGGFPLGDLNWYPEQKASWQDQQDELAMQIKDLVSTDIESVGDENRSFTLHRSYPNPFTSSTTIEYELNQAGNVTLEVYDLLGRRVRALVDRTATAGTHTVTFEGGELPSGVYFYRLETSNGQQVRKATLVK